MRRVKISSGPTAVVKPVKDSATTLERSGDSLSGYTDPYTRASVSTDNPSSIDLSTPSFCHSLDLDRETARNKGTCPRILLIKSHPRRPRGKGKVSWAASQFPHLVIRSGTAVADHVYGLRYRVGARRVSNLSEEQRNKKRENDRIAQQNIRRRNKELIEKLQQEVEDLRKRDRVDMVSRLIRRNRELENEVHALRKTLFLHTGRPYPSSGMYMVVSFPG